MDDDLRREQERATKNVTEAAPPGEGGSGRGTGETASLLEAERFSDRGAPQAADVAPRPGGGGLAALRHQDYRRYWTAQLFSLVGTWMQSVAQSWLVLELTNSPLALGTVSALQFLPILLLSVFGGVVADRVPKRRILLVTQTASMLLAFVLAALVQTKTVQVWHVLVLATLLGLINAIDMPTRQAFIAELVGPRDLHNAIALNSAAFNTARLVGPSIAGVAIASVGLAAAFFLNGLSFTGVIFVMFLLQRKGAPTARRAVQSSLWVDLREGLGYVAHTPAVLLLVSLVAVVGTFAMNLNVLVPVLARDVLQVGPQGYGLLTSASGIGSLSAAFLIAYLGRRIRPRAILVASVGLGLAEMALAGLEQFAPALVLLAVVGFSLIFFNTLANTFLQTTVPNHLRGRVMSVYTTVFAGTTPIGSLFAGSLTQSFGVGVPFFIGGLIAVLAAAVASRFVPSRRTAA